ncbi:hypothetical protein MRX96_034270 [Rhipicephalus microplus]
MEGACLRDSERLTVLAWQDLGRGLLLSENPHLRARFQIVHRRRDERRKVLAWRGRALSGYRLPSDDLGRGLLLSENPHLRARFQIVHRRRDERRKVLAWRGRALSGYRLPSDGPFSEWARLTAAISSSRAVHEVSPDRADTPVSESVSNTPLSRFSNEGDSILARLPDTINAENQGAAQRPVPATGAAQTGGDRPIPAAEDD